MKIKKGDKVKVITGAYKGTIAEVIKAMPKENKVIVEGVKMCIRDRHRCIASWCKP